MSIIDFNDFSSKREVSRHPRHVGEPAEVSGDALRHAMGDDPNCNKEFYASLPKDFRRAAIHKAEKFNGQIVHGAIGVALSMWFGVAGAVSMSSPAVAVAIGGIGASALWIKSALQKSEQLRNQIFSFKNE